MYQKIKHTVFFAIYLLLWSRFLVMIWDPAIGQVALDEGLPIYQSWRPAFDWLYYLSYFLFWPVETVYYSFIQPSMPTLEWFPGVYSMSLLQQVEAVSKGTPALVALLQTPAIKEAMVGYIDFLVFITVLIYRGVSFIVDPIYEYLKNLIYTFLIEFSFTKKKEASYQDALQKRAADLVKLNVQYKNLSKEATMLATSVITDELTKVYNKRFFLEKIEHEFVLAKEKKRLLAIAMVDIDHFKKLNDTYGHLMGDKVLQAVAQVAKQATPKEAFCCRFGGEEFSIIMPDRKLEDVMDIVGTVHRNLPLLRFVEDPNLRTSASFGVCIVDFKNPLAQQNVNTFEEFIKLADDELYRAKLNGRNRYEINTQFYIDSLPDAGDSGQASA